MATISNNSVLFEQHVLLGLGKAAMGISLAMYQNYLNSNSKVIAITRPNNELKLAENSDGFCNVEIANKNYDRLQIYRLKFFHAEQMSYDEFTQTLPKGVVGVVQTSDIDEINNVIRNATSISTCLGPQGLAAYAKPNLLSNSEAKVFYFFENDNASCDSFEKIAIQGNSAINFQRAMINRVVDKREVIGNTIRLTASTVGTVSLFDPFQLFSDEPNEYNQLILRRRSNKNEIDLEKAIKHRLFNNIHAYATLCSYDNILGGCSDSDWASLNIQNLKDINLIIEAAKASLQYDFFAAMLNNNHFHTDCDDMLKSIIQVAPLTIDRLFPQGNEAKVNQRSEQFSEIFNDLETYLTIYPEFSIEISEIQTNLKASWDRLSNLLI